MELYSRAQIEIVQVIFARILRETVYVHNGWVRSLVVKGRFCCENSEKGNDAGENYPPPEKEKLK